MLTWLFRILTSVLVIVLWLFWLLFFSERPALETDPAVLAGDGSTVDYCGASASGAPSVTQAKQCRVGTAQGRPYSHRRRDQWQ